MEWKDIHGWEDYYAVSDNGDVMNKETGKLIVGDKNNIGYCRVCLYRKGHNPAKQRFFRHRLVAEHFIPNPHNLEEVNHIDLDKTNNNVSNLEWVSPWENNIHSRMSRVQQYKPYIVEFKDGKQEWFNSCPQLAKRLNVNPRTVKLWLRRDNKGYLKYDITNLWYVNL